MIADRRSRGAILPVLFIAAGILLLLNTLDVLAWDVWPQVARFWPVVVIAFGVNLLWQHLRRSQ